MAYSPVDEDRGPAVGRRFGVRVGPFVVADVLAVRGVRMRNTRLVAVVSVVQDGVTGEWTASLAYSDRDEMPEDGDENWDPA